MFDSVAPMRASSANLARTETPQDESVTLLARLRLTRPLNTHKLQHVVVFANYYQFTVFLFNNDYLSKYFNSLN